MIKSQKLYGAIAATLLLAACQDNTVSLEKAKQITAAFQGPSYVAPPRTINDLLRRFPDVALPATVLDAPACGRDGVPRLGFEYKIKALKGMLKQRGGRDRIKIPEEFRSFPWTRNIKRGYNIYAKLASDYQMVGNIPEAIKYRELKIANDPFKLHVSDYAQLAKTYVLAGNLTAAEKALDRADRDAGLQRTPSPFMLMSIALAEAAVAEAKGDLARAEAKFREALKTIREDLPESGRLSLVNSELARVLARQGRLIEAESAVREAMIDRLDQKKRVLENKDLRKKVKELGVDPSRAVGKLFSPNAAAIAHRLSTILYEQGRHIEAEKIARAAVFLYQDKCVPANSVEVANARRSLAESLAAQKRWPEAVALFEAIETAMRDQGSSFETLFAGDPTWALALLNSGREQEALAMLGKAHGKLLGRLGRKHYQTAETLGILGIALARTGDKKGALDAFRGSIDILLRRSRRANTENTGEGVLSQRRAMILDAYVGHLGDIRGTDIERRAGIDAAAEAFWVADVVRSSSVQGALAASGARAAAGNAELAEMARREQDAQMRIAALAGTLANLMAAGGGDKTAAKDIRTRIDELRKARAVLAEAIEERFPEYADLVNPKPATIANVQATMHRGEALIATYVTDEKTFVWAVPKTGEVAFAVVPLGRERIAAIVADLRSALDPQAATLGDIPEFNLRLSHRLYKTLLEPVQAGWKEASSLLVVAHEALGQLPFQVLVTGNARLPKERGALFANYDSVPWLARSHAVTVLPSVTSLASLRALPAAKPGRRAFAGFGDPYFSKAQALAAAKPKPEPVQVAALTSRGAFKVRGLPLALRAAPKTRSVDSADLAKLPRLPDTADEVRSIALALGADLTRDVFLGGRATEEAVKTADLSRYKVITFATHGLVPGDLNGLTQPALALSSPNLLGTSKEDGLLTMGEILSLRLDADWVVLSACNTAAGNGAGAEAFTGLGRAFFYAGTRAMLLSNWPVETTSVRALTTDLFKRQADDPTLTRAEALRQAMLGLIDGKGFVDKTSGKIVFSYAHPIFWAPFSLVGDGGGGRVAG